MEIIKPKGDVTSPYLGAANVELMGPHLMLLYVTDAVPDLLSRGWVASSTGNTGGASILSWWVRSVEPKHICSMIIPDGHNKNHALLQGCSHVSETSLGLELVSVTKGSLLCIAEGIGERIAFYSSDGGRRVRDNLAILDIKPLDVSQSSGGCTITGDELGDDSELGTSIDSHSLSVEVERTHAVRVVIASVSIAQRGVSGAHSTVCPSAASLFIDRARMTRIRRG
jgi:hypothetical protein